GPVFWTPVAAIGLFAGVMLFRISWPVWQLPQMRFLQFPWRWMLIVNLALCLLGAFALRHVRMPWIWAIAIVAFVGWTTRNVIRQATWGHRAETEIHAASAPYGYRGAVEYLPRDAGVIEPDRLPLTPLARSDCSDGCPGAALAIEAWDPEEK